MILRPGDLRRPADTDVSDLTKAKRCGVPFWHDDGETLEVPFDPEPTAEEQKAIRRRLLTADATEEARVVAMQEALADLSSSGKVAAALRVVLQDRLGPLAE